MATTTLRTTTGRHPQLGLTTLRIYQRLDGKYELVAHYDRNTTVVDTRSCGADADLAKVEAAYDKLAAQLSPEA